MITRQLTKLERKLIAERNEWRRNFSALKVATANVENLLTDDLLTTRKRLELAAEKYNQLYEKSILQERTIFELRQRIEQLTAPASNPDYNNGNN